VNESGRRPANQQSAVELQVCQGELAQMRGLVIESRKLAESSSAALAQVVVGQFQRVSDSKAPAPGASAQPGALGANVVWTVRFGFNSTHIEVAPEELQQVIDGAKAAAYVVVKGRTDGTVETAAESKVAQGRMGAMYDLLLKAGVDARKVALQYQAVGDRIAENQSSEGRAANRRVEVELYPVAPERIVVHNGPVLSADSTL
jgi:outer membrane protein OmpA-like peptidoglycan-associated protein